MKQREGQRERQRESENLKEMVFYTSDWHIHTEASYDAELTAEQLTEGCRRQGIVRCGITDHVNLPSWGDTLLKSREILERCTMSGIYLGVELTTRAKHVCEYDRLHPGERSPIWDGATERDEIELTLNAEELARYGVDYVLGAAHWILTNTKDAGRVVRDMHRQNMWLAQDPRVDIVGHPFWIYGELDTPKGKMPFDDMSLISRQMREEFGAALRENGKAVEYNLMSFAVEGCGHSESFCYAYAEFIRALYEQGVPVTIGSDEHGHGGGYGNYQNAARKYLSAVGFLLGDFSEPKFRSC